MDARTATVRDTEELLRLATVMFEAVGADASHDDWRVNGRLRLEAGFDAGTVAAFVVDHPTIGGRAVAGAAVTIDQHLPTTANPDGRLAYVQWVATDAEFRRRGLARVVMESTIAWVRERGVHRVDLHASADGLPLYRALGFEATHTPGLVLNL
jgi:GNAT superfamily N-acetyltransferase